jgi:hypothetical protein
VLIKELESLRKPTTKKRLEDLETLLNSGSTILFMDLMNYLKHKLYRRKIVGELFEQINYKPGMKYAGITISKWHFDYLASKSLTPVLSKQPVEITTINEMKYSIKCLIKLNKIMNAKRALLWVRNMFAKKLNREQAGTKRTEMEIQEKRFYNTYIFEEDVSYEEFSNTQSKTTQFFKQYKQLDREVNANYLSRYYNKETSKARKDHQIGNVKIAITAHMYKGEIGEFIDKNKTIDYKPKRNPVAAYRRIVDMVEKKFRETHTKIQRLEIVNSLEDCIPQITFGTKDPNTKYIKFCRNAIKKYKNNKGSSYQDETAGLKEAIKRSKEEKERMKLKGKEEETSDDETTDSEIYYSDYDDDYEVPQYL